MLFNSYLFIFIFFPLCITGFYALRIRGQEKLAKAWLIGFSLWFYGFYSTSYLIIMILSVALNRVLSDFLWILKGYEPQTNICKGMKKLLNRIKASEKAVLITGVTLNLVVLGYFKYLDFLIQNLTFITKIDIPLRNIVLPLGISFFTFQQIGYLVDIYRNEAKPSTFLDYALFVTFFPQLVAGPIVSHEEMMPQFQNMGDKQINVGKVFDSEGFARGLSLFIMGLAKKVLIADTLGAGVDAGYSMIGVLGGLDSLLVILWYTLQLYFDFSGYCDMAMGLAQMLGFCLPLNFDSPYKASNIVEFWKRWHMTLTRFFTKYVYIPLGGSRRGTPRMIVNILVVYFLSGLWHGAGWNYVLWGMLHGILYVITRMVMLIWKKRSDITEISGTTETTDTSETTGTDHAGVHEDQSGSDPNVTQKKKISPASVAGTILTFAYVNLCWVFFRAPSVADAVVLIRRLLSGSWTSVNATLSGAVTPDEIWYVIKALKFERIGYVFAKNAGMAVTTLIALLIVFAFPNAYAVSRRLKPKAVIAVLLGVLGMWCIISLSGVSTFLYFNF